MRAPRLAVRQNQEHAQFGTPFFRRAGHIGSPDRFREWGLAGFSNVQEMVDWPGRTSEGLWKSRFLRKLSRSQAKRLLQRVDLFRSVVLDFGQVSSIG